MKISDVGRLESKCGANGHYILGNLLSVSPIFSTFSSLWALFAQFSRSEFVGNPGIRIRLIKKNDFESYAVELFIQHTCGLADIIAWFGL